jgi:DnaJ family protein C protein 17
MDSTLTIFIIAQKFHELKQAQELLLDPQRRAELDASLKRQRDHAERYANANAKRKQMMDALDERERETKKAKTMSALDKRKEEEKLQELKEASRRMREERDASLAREAGQEHVPEENLQGEHWNSKPLDWV